MSEVQNVPAPAAVEEVSPITEPVALTEAPKIEAIEEPKTEAAPAAEETKAEEAAPVVEKAVEPITEGQLAYKGPGLVKSLIPSKKEFWLNDAAVEADNLNLFLRGEKPEIAYPVVAWATQTGKGLLFFNKKGDTERSHPNSILDLYNATDLKKESGHQFGFKLHGSNHTFKAANDAERDGWYISIEKAIELGKASQEEIQASESYKAEVEKLNKAQSPAIAAGAAKTRNQSQPKKSTDIDRANSVTGEEDADKKKKARSTSRGLFGRRKANADEAEQKPADKESEENKEDAKPEVEAVAPAAAVAAGGVVATEAATTEEKPAEPAAEIVEPTEAKAEEAPKPAKRGSIFGKLSGWKSPAKEKDQKEAELKSEAAAVDAPALETTPVAAEPAAIEETALPVVDEPSVEAPKEEVVTPNKEKSKFLSGLGFTKRGRSVSPSNIPKEAPKAEEVPAAAEGAAELVDKPEEPVVEAAPTTEAADKPAEEVKTEASANKRQSILGSLGRRASKAFKGIQSPKQETAPVAEATKEETAAETAPVEVGAETKALEAEASQNHIGDVVPEAVSVGQPEQSTPVVAASA